MLRCVCRLTWITPALFKSAHGNSWDIYIHDLPHYYNLKIQNAERSWNGIRRFIESEFGDSCLSARTIAVKLNLFDPINILWRNSGEEWRQTGFAVGWMCVSTHLRLFYTIFHWMGKISWTFYSPNNTCLHILMDKWAH